MTSTQPKILFEENVSTPAALNYLRVIGYPEGVHLAIAEGHDVHHYGLHSPQVRAVRDALSSWLEDHPDDEQP